MKKRILSILGLGVILMAAGCNKEHYIECEVLPINYGERVSFTTKEEVSTYLSDVNIDNKPVENGIIMSPYFTMKINDVEVPVYATRTANTVHSFAYVDIVRESKEKVDLKVEIQGSSIKRKFTTVHVLPESRGVKASFENKKVTASIHQTGNYSFVFNEEQREALTLMVADKADLNSLLEGRTKVDVEPGSYKENTNLSLTQQNTVYYFKKGDYEIGTFAIPSNSVIYFEEGAYLKLYPDNKNPITANSKENIGIYGRGLLDFSSCNGSQLSSTQAAIAGKGGLSLNYSNHVNIEGLMLINAQTWQCMLGNCENIYIRDCMFYGYRTYADGIMLNNCKDALVEYNFIRTGDDAFETKSTSSNGLTERVVFQYNSAWTDKAVAYGTIYESRCDTSGVQFLHNSVGFANGTWSRHLGCAVVQMGDRVGAKMFDITFDDMEIFHSDNQALCNIYIGGSGGMGAGSGNVNNIYFKNIKCSRNGGKALNLQTYDAENCSIKNVYLDNVVTNDVKVTKSNFASYVDYEHVVGGYNLKYLHINGEKCG